MDIERQNFFKEIEQENKNNHMKNNLSIKEKMMLLEQFFFQKEINPADYGHNITVNGVKVIKVCGNYVEDENEDAIYIEDLTDDEVEDLILLMEEVDADDYKTQKRISD